jgi:hypothetical protein
LEAAMFRTIGYAFLVIVIGTLAIAWSYRSDRVAGNPQVTIAPNDLLLKAGPLPTDDIDDKTFVYSK